MVELRPNSGYAAYLKKKRKKIALLCLVSFLCWALVYPTKFIHLWLTPDQYGQVLFKLGYYQQSAAAYETPYRKALAYYASEDFSKSASLFSQYNDFNALLGRANALAHERNYVPAVRLYRDILTRYPERRELQTNIDIVQALIDANTQMSESQLAEQGDSSSSQQDGPQSSEGDDRQFFETQPVEQLSAEQLLQNPSLTEMWMRQVQKDPSGFLQVKFYMQLERQNQGEASKEEQQ
ncbi:hypothetical protein SAMN02745866_02543 [Alteromonadaceae bacterium Bs31]|nr:hypothetical protein SAMN02745866_02543 [Alteromonadaceae bacterium Bs31]